MNIKKKVTLFIVKDHNAPSLHLCTNKKKKSFRPSDTRPHYFWMKNNKGSKQMENGLILYISTIVCVSQGKVSLA
uniref:Uncharacterized protein n=1 Tax=Anguilla anguilla TaxID=7936 RepID=A0A0E9QMA4_ANGAN